MKKLWNKHHYLLLAGGGVLLITLSLVAPMTEGWGQTFQAVVGGFLLCQSIYTRWLDDYSLWLTEAHGHIERLIALIDQRRSGAGGLN